MDTPAENPTLENIFTKTTITGQSPVAAAVGGIAIFPRPARPSDTQAPLQFARVDLHAGQKGQAPTTHSPGEHISMIVGRAANDSLVTLSVIAPLKTPQL